MGREERGREKEKPVRKKRKEGGSNIRKVRKREEEEINRNRNEKESNEDRKQKGNKVDKKEQESAGRGGRK